jgi:hypothetical protein
MTLTSPITANLGDYITQFSNANARILESVTNSNVVAVNFETASNTETITENVVAIPNEWTSNAITISANLSIAAQDTLMGDIFFKADGIKMYSIGSTNNRVYEYT